MAKCPFCDADLDRLGLRDGHCPSCSSVLEWKEDLTIDPAQADLAAPPVPDSGAPQIDPSTDSMNDLRATLQRIVRRGAAESDNQLSTPVPSLLGAAGENPGADSLATLDSAAIAPSSDSLATIDSAHFSAASDSSATIDSVSLPVQEGDSSGGGPGEGHSTFDERRFAKTIDSDSFSREQTDKLAGMWRGTYSPTTTPRMTIKGVEPAEGSARDSRLVIKSRAVAQTDGMTRTGADYELIELIGEGGVGVVYAARQASIDRTVAVKMLKPQSANLVEQREKFLSEAVVTGDLDHPNIVPIYDLGANDTGALFYSMKRVQGTPWHSVMARKSLPENLEILLKVADAVGFAHSRGVIHRDLKPENVMLGDFGEVLVMDWGLAVSTPEFRKAGSITQSGSMGGTPAYMAPEMATGPIEVVTPSADIYLLGAILYEIIAGQPPHTGKNVMACLFAAARNEIQPTTYSGELLEVARKAMSTDPKTRHPSARDFQTAIREYQAHSESIALSTRADEDLKDAERTNDYQSYSRALFAFQEAAALWEGNTRALAGVSAAKLAYARSATNKEDYDLAASLLDAADPAHTLLARQIAAAQAERNARQQRLRNAKRMAVGLAAALLIIITVALAWVSHLADVAAKEAETAVREKNAADKARNDAVASENSAKTSARIAEVRRQEAVTATKTAVQAKTAAEEAQAATLLAKSQEEQAAYIARIGLAAARIDENAFGEVEQILEEGNPELRGWEWGRLKFLCGRALATYPALQQAEFGPVDSVAFARDGQQFVTGSWDRKVRVWSAADSRQPIRELDYGALYVHAVAFSPDGKLIAAGGNDPAGFVKVWKVDTGKLVRSVTGHTDSVLSVAFDKAGKRLLTTSYDNTARITALDDSAPPRVFDGHTWWVWSAAFSPDETQVVSASQDGTCVVWPVQAPPADARPVPAQFTGHQGPVYAAEFSADGKWIVSGGNDRRVLLWRVSEAKPYPFEKLSQPGLVIPPPRFYALEGHAAAVRSVHFAQHKGKPILLTGGDDNTIRVWDVASRTATQVLRGHAGAVRKLDTCANEDLVVSASLDKQAKLWNIAGYAETHALKSRHLDGHADAVLHAAFSPAGDRVVTSSRDRTAKIWDWQQGTELQNLAEGHEFLASTGVFLRDERHFATAAADNTVRIWDLTRGVEVHRLDKTGRSAALAISHNGKYLLTGGNKKQAQLWDAITHERLAELGGHEQDVSAVAFSPADDLILTCDTDGLAQLWKFGADKPLWSVHAHSSAINAATFTPDGRRVLTASSDNTVGQFDVATGKESSGGVLSHPQGVLSVAVTPDGATAVTAGVDGAVRVWNIQPGSGPAREIRSLAGLLGKAGTAAIDAEGKRMLTVAALPAGQDAAGRKLAAGQRSAVQFWDLASGQEQKADRITAGMVWSAAFAPSPGKVLLVGGNGARLWQMGGQESLMNFTSHGAVASANYSPDGKFIVTGGWDISAKIWDAATGKPVLRLAFEHEGFINSAVFSPDGRAILTASDDGTARLWDARDGRELRRFVGHADRVRSAQFSADGRLVITASNDKTAKIWFLDGKELMTLSGHEWPVVQAAFDSAANRVVTASEDNSARIWDLCSGQDSAPFVQLDGHTAAVTSACFSPDGDRVVTGSRDATAKVWDVASGKEILTLRGHTQEVTSVAFSPNGLYVVTGGREGNAIVWLASDWRVVEPAPVPRLETARTGRTAIRQSASQ